MQIRGIKMGKNIQLKDDIAIPDGQEITIKIQLPIPLTPEERWQQLSQLFGAWSEQPDLKEPSIWDLGSNPVECDVKDGAVNHDRY
jgi:hypothetical protein